jgi:hypothetical protein
VLVCSTKDGRSGSHQSKVVARDLGQDAIVCSAACFAGRADRVFGRDRSREAALVRLLTLGLTTQSFYDRMRDEFRAQYEKQQREKEASSGFAPPHVVAISSAGPLFTGLVVESLNRDKITASEVSDYLQIRLKHLKELQGEFSKGA